MYFNFYVIQIYICMHTRNFVHLSITYMECQPQLIFPSLTTELTPIFQICDIRTEGHKDIIKVPVYLLGFETLK